MAATRAMTSGLDPAYFDLVTSMNQPVASQSFVHFRSKVGLGRIAAAAAGIGVWIGGHAIVGMHAAVASSDDALSPTPQRLATLRWTVYAVALGLFHFLEFAVTAAFNPRTATFDSFLLNHSRAYHIAVVSGMAEFWFEAWYLAPWLKSGSGYIAWGLFVLALLVVAVGQAFRSGAQWTARHNFTHQIREMHDEAPEHVLVTGGLFKYLRHPSYFGFFWFSVGLQLLLANPLCLALHTWASWKFFAQRIPHEEETLSHHFGKERYRSYAEATPIGIPMIPTAVPFKPSAALSAKSGDGGAGPLL